LKTVGLDGYEKVLDIINSPYNTDWKKATQKEYAYQQNMDLSVSGGNDKLTYFTSLNYFDQNSTVKGSNFKRVAGSTSVTYQATDKLKLSTDIQMAFSRANTQPQGGHMRTH
jgi:hypothetical protein